MICCIVTLLHCLTVSTVSVGLTASISLSRHFSICPSLPRCLTVATVYVCLTASLPHCLAASLPRCLTASLPHCPTASLPLLYLSASLSLRCHYPMSLVKQCPHAMSGSDFAGRLRLLAQHILAEQYDIVCLQVSHQPTESTSRALSVHRIQFQSALSPQTSVPQHFTVFTSGALSVFKIR